MPVDNGRNMQLVQSAPDAIHPWTPDCPSLLRQAREDRALGRHGQVVCAQLISTTLAQLGAPSVGQRTVSDWENDKVEQPDDANRRAIYQYIESRGHSLPWNRTATVDTRPGHRPPLRVVNSSSGGKDDSPDDLPGFAEAVVHRMKYGPGLSKWDYRLIHDLICTTVQSSEDHDD